MSHEHDTSRRNFLKASAGVVAAGAIPATASAQGIGTELNRLQGSRRILLKGGVVLTMDRQLGDFAKADVLIEDGRIREIRPDIAASDAFVVDASNRPVGMVHLHELVKAGLGGETV